MILVEESNAQLKLLKLCDWNISLRDILDYFSLIGQSE